MKSLIALFISCCVIIAFAFYCPRWQKTGGESALGWDVSGYYSYLPAMFIYHDLKDLRFTRQALDKYQFTPSLMQATRLETGNYVLTYSSGMSVMYLPFFWVAHVMARPLGYPADGFSKPYVAMISIGSILIAFLGLILYRKFLRYFFSDTTTAIMILILAVGTNYLNYTAIDGSLSHNWLFFLYAALLISTKKFYDTLHLKYAVLSGGLCGMLILTRPSEIIAVLIPLLWNLQTITVAAIKERLHFFARNIGKVSLAVCALFLVGSIQIAYWLYVTSEPLFYSYGNQGFSWLHPHFLDYMLSYRSGWLMYTPMLLLSIIGIVPLVRSGKNRVMILVFFIINLYIVSAWDIWWYGGTGGRAMIQSYPIILLPIATLVEVFLKNRKIAYLAPFIILFAYVNIWFTFQAHGLAGLYDAESMNRKYYWSVVGRWSVDPDVYKLKDAQEIFPEKVTARQVIYRDGFEGDAVPPGISAVSGNGALYVDGSTLNSRKITIPVPYSKDEAWYRVEAQFHINQKEWEGWKMAQFIVSFNKGNEAIKTSMIRVQRFLSDKETKILYLDIKVPDEPYDSLQVGLWNPGSDKPVVMDDLNISTIK